MRGNAALLTEGPGVQAAQARLPLGLLAAAGFLSMACARVMDPLLAEIATDFRVGVPATSIVIAAFTLSYGLNQLVLGPLGDRFGKLRVMLGALAGFVLFTGLCATAANLPMLVLLRALSGAMSAGMIPAAMAYIGDAMPYELRQITISRYMIGNVLGLTMAGPIGGIIGEFLGWRMVFIVLAMAGAGVSALLAWRLHALPDPRHPGPLVNLGNYRNLAARRSSRRLLLATAAEGAITTGAFPFLAAFLHQDFALSYAAAGVILAFFGVGAFLYTRVATPLLPRLGEPGFVLLGGGMIVLSLVLATLLRGWIGFVALETVLGLGYYLLHGVLQARATELLPHARSTAMASFSFMLFLGQSIGALMFATWIAAVGYRWSLLADAGLMLLLTVALYALIRSAVSAQVRAAGE